jgi:hypothetical protein
MDMLLALAVSIGVLIGVWTYLAASFLALPVWVGIIAWGTFYAAGGKTDGLVKTIGSNLSGLVWVFIAMTVAAKVGGGTGTLSVILAVVAFFLVIQSKISILSFIPGAFIGAATTVGAGGSADPSSLGKIAAAFVLGAVFGYLSELGAGALARKSTVAPLAA